MSKIRIKKKNRGKLHSALGIPQGEKIPASKLKVKESDSPSMVKMKTFARNAKKWKHENGGIALGGSMMMGEKLYAEPGLTVPDNTNLTGLPELDFLSPTMQNMNWNSQYNNSTPVNYPQALTPSPEMDNPRNFNRDGMINLRSNNPYINKIGQGLDGIQSGNPLGITGGAVKAAIGATQGLTNLIGNIKTNRNTQNQELDRLYNQSSGVLFSPYNSDYNDEQYGQNRNQAYFANGGAMNQYKAEYGANVEVEGNEFIQLPDGLAAPIYGASHDNGGIDVNLPSQSRVFSDKLKVKLPKGKKKSFAQLAKPYETEKDIESLESPYSDYINKGTADLNIKMKNLKLDELFQAQELSKLKGDFGADVKKEAMKNNRMKYGGKIKKMADGDVVDPYSVYSSTQYNNDMSMMNEIPEVSNPLRWSEKIKLRHYHRNTADKNAVLMANEDPSVAPGNSPNGFYRYNSSSATNSIPIIPVKGGINTNNLYNITTNTDYSIPGSRNVSTPENPYFSPEDRNKFTSILYQGNNLPSPYTDQAGFDTKFNASPFSKEDVPDVMKQLNQLGYNGDWNNASSIQQFIFDKDKANGYPIAKELFNNYKNTEQGRKELGDRNWEDLTDSDVNKVFVDNLYGIRTGLAQRTLGKPNLNFAPDVPKADVPTGVNPLDVATTYPARTRRKGLALNLAVPRSYAESPLQVIQNTPELIDPRYLNIQPQVNEINRVQRGLFNNNQGNSSVDRSNLANSQAQAYNQLQQTFGQKYNYDRNQDANAQQFNAQALTNNKLSNTQLANTFMDNIQRRRGIVDTQKRVDAVGDINYTNQANQYNQTDEWLQSMLNPSANYGTPVSTPKKRKKFKK